MVPAVFLVDLAFCAQEGVVAGHPPLAGPLGESDSEDALAFLGVAADRGLVAVQYVGGTRTRSQPLKVVKGGKTSEFNQARRFALPSMLTRGVATGQESQVIYAECA